MRARSWALARTHITHALATLADPALLARLHGWHAQALCELGEFQLARNSVRQALLSARDLGESKSLVPLKDLHGRITSGLIAQATADSHRAEAQALAAQPLDALLAAAPDPTARAGVYLARADAMVDAGRPHEVPGLVRSGLRAAPVSATREQVLLRLAHLRIRPPGARDILAQALAIADEADSHNLIAAVAQAARALGLELPEQTF
jgi:hypothetical protein